MVKRKNCFLLFLLLALLSLCFAGETAENKLFEKNSMPVKVVTEETISNSTIQKNLRIALCHLDVSQGPQEKNIEKIEKAIHMAGQHGANWILTPETALQGYYFYVIDPSQKEKVTEQPSAAIKPLVDAAKKYKATLFLGAGEFDAKANCNRNSCLIFGSDGKLIGRHSKLSAHVGFGAEVWSTNDNKLNPLECNGVSTGVLVCSDIWFLQYPRILADKGAQIILDIAAWPPTKETGNPLPSWELASERTGLPVVICNQTGTPRWMDMTPGQSAVVDKGKAKLLYSGQEAVLLFDWNPETGKVVSEEFKIVPVKASVEVE